MRPPLFVLAVLACSHRSASDLREATCLGPADAAHFAVYVHGIDDKAIGDEELANRTNLAHIADALSMRIALPRATEGCPNQPDSRCWGWTFSDSEVVTATTTIAKAANACFGNRAYGVIGFSNGGYLLSRLVATCTLHKLLAKSTWSVTIGAATFHGELPAEPASLAGCGRVVVVSGTRDTQNFDPTNHLVELLTAKGADVTASSFDGGHVVPDKPLRHVLAPLLR